MFQFATRASRLALLGVSLAFAGDALSDPANGFCNGLDPSSGLFSTCIQAHSAANLLQHLQGVGANEKAIARAQLALDEALETYAGLPGGGTVPGFMAPVPILVVAYINTDGEEGYNAEKDTLIAKITDEDRSGHVSKGDIITTNKYPTNFVGGEGDFTNTTHQILYEGETDVIQSAKRVEVFTECSGEYWIPGEVADGVRCDFVFEAAYDGLGYGAGCLRDLYQEQIESGFSFSGIKDIYGLGCPTGSPTGEDVIVINRIQVNGVATTPSEPSGDGIHVSQSDVTDNGFIDVDINIQLP